MYLQFDIDFSWYDFLWSDIFMNERDGGEQIKCPKCLTLFQPLQWQIESRDHRCLPCKRLQQNTLNLNKGDLLKIEAKEAYQRRKEYYKNYWQEKRLDPLHLLKRKARRKVATEIEAGRLKRLNCEKCDAVKTDAHHKDYTKPLDVNWLCRRCHFKEDKHAPN
jgi:ribosomal protein S27AE